jgi:hypothetical protein
MLISVAHILKDIINNYFMEITAGLLKRAAPSDELNVETYFKTDIMGGRIESSAQVFVLRLQSIISSDSFLSAFDEDHSLIWRAEIWTP